MSRLAVVFPDAMLASATFLRSALPVYTPDVLVVTKEPEVDDPRPYVWIRAQTPQTRYPVSEVTPLHIVTAALDEFDTLALAQTARALLLAFPGDAAVRGYFHRLGPAPADDPDTGEPIAAFTVAASLKPLPL